MGSASHFLVFEKKGFWAAALRWHAGSRPLPLKELRSLIDVRSELRSRPGSVVALETTTGTAEGVMHLLLKARQTRPATPVIILLSPEVRGLANLFWELGADLVVESPRRLDRVARWVQRRLANQQPSSELTTREWVWSRLPWKPEPWTAEPS